MSQLENNDVMTYEEAVEHDNAMKEAGLMDDADGIENAILEDQMNDRDKEL